MSDEDISATPPQPSPDNRWDDDELPTPNVRKPTTAKWLWSILTVFGAMAIVAMMLILLAVGQALQFRLRGQQVVNPQPAAGPPKGELPPLKVELPKAAAEPLIFPPVAPRHGRLELIKGPRRSLAVNVKSTNVREVVFAEQTSILSYHGWEIVKNGGIRGFVETWNWKDGKFLSRVNLPNRDIRFMDLNPVGSRLLMHYFSPGSLSIISVPDGKMLKEGWMPDRGVLEMPIGLERGLASMTWSAFIDDEKFITVARSGRFDLWDGIQEKPVYTVDARPRGKGPLREFLAEYPCNIAISRDRKTMVLPANDCFEFFSTLTGKSLGKTSPDSFVSTSSVSFSRDGGRLACVHTIRRGEQLENALTIWTVPTGEINDRFALDKNVSKHVNRLCSLTWIDDKHLMSWNGSAFKGFVFNMDTGRFQRIVDAKEPGIRFARQSPDDSLWFPASGADKVSLVAVECPWQDLQNDPVVDIDHLPRWIAGADGISRELLPK